MLRSFIFALAVLAASAPAFAQEFGRIEATESNVPSYYYHARSGDAVVQAYVIGAVRASGLYVVTQGTDIGQLFALAGGPMLGERERQDRVEVTIRLYREGGGSRELIYESLLEPMLRDPGAYPTLMDGDVMEVENIRIRAFSWRDGLGLIGAAASVALVIERVVRIAN